MILSPNALRILGTLSEKQRTVPDTYPLSLNTLLAGCNQKTSRSPVMEVTEAGAVLALEELREHGLVSDIFGNRVTRFAHHLEKVIGIPSQASALLTVLILRGPQTAGELRLNCERLHSFADISSVEAFLEEMAEREEDPLVVQLPRAPGSRENRWMHLLGGQPVIEESSGSVSHASSSLRSEIEELRERVSTLESEMAAMKALLTELSS